MVYLSGASFHLLETEADIRSLMYLLNNDTIIHMFCDTCQELLFEEEEEICIDVKVIVDRDQCVTTKPSKLYTETV